MPAEEGFPAYLASRALILASLDVNADIIMEDYRLSNDYFNIPKASKYAYNLPVNSQEAITTLFSAKEDLTLYEANVAPLNEYCTSGIFH